MLLMAFHTGGDTEDSSDQLNTLEASMEMVQAFDAESADRGHRSVNNQSLSRG